jgi:hypothetical protein
MKAATRGARSSRGRAWPTQDYYRDVARPTLEGAVDWSLTR